MKQLLFSYHSNHISSQALQDVKKRLEFEIQRVHAAWDSGYTSAYASLSLPFDKELLQQTDDLVQEKKALNPSMLVVIGIGGSSLATMAVAQALQTIQYEAERSISIYFADSVDTKQTGLLYAQVQQALEHNATIMLIIISKSGTTVETAANAQLFTALLAAYKQDYGQYIIVISDQGSPLWSLAQRHAIACLPIVQSVGGRFSLCSPVALFPLQLLGIDTVSLVEGARSVKEYTQAFSHNYAALSAAILFILYQKGFYIHDSFFFEGQCEGIGKWYRQLLAESIGKLGLESKRVGITPTVSIGSTDLHSMVQLYLAGPNNRITTFVSAQHTERIRVPSHTLFASLVSNIQEKSYSEIMRALLEGAKKAYIHEQRPLISVELPEISAYYIGQFMQYKMIEVMYLGALLQVNPFDQPQVELYKQETRKILAHE